MNLRWRLIITCVITALSIVYVLPSIPGVSSSPLAKLLPNNTINLGLDLKGGIHLTLGVEVDKAVENSAAQTAMDLRVVAKEKDVFVLKPEVEKNGRIAFVLPKPEQQEKLEDLIRTNYRDYTIENKQVLDGGKVRFTLAMKPEYKKHVADMALDQAVKTIRNRVDQFGVAEPDIRKQQDYRIQIQLPGLDDTARAIQILGKTAHLEFKLVDEEADVEKAAKGIVPSGSEVRLMQTRGPNGAYTESPIVLKKEAAMTGEYVSDANTNFDSYNQPYVMLNFNPAGARLFERLTTENVKRRMAIVLDGKVYSAPVIQERIAGGRASISGRFTVPEAHDLAIVLRAGALPAPVKVLEERTVGPSLGQESIDKSLFAGLVGAGLVLLFMAVYYGFSGVVADLVVVLNIVLIMAGLAMFHATLTLPGIAGIILVVAMAVDANVLINERIREELRRGLTVKSAIEEGYRHATMTIVDANLTTIISAVVLYQFGTGPIRGFAVTLIIGLVASMFSAVFVSHLIMDIWAHYRPNAKLSV
jgi:preprotein translocase subunit SecD